MAKIKVVQMIFAGDKSGPWLLDDQGRVWAKFRNEDFTFTWKQVALPEEPVIKHKK